MRQGLAPIAYDLVELHEHQVPDLDESVAILFGASRWASGDSLTVIVENSAWMQELQFMKREIIDRLNREIARLPTNDKGQIPLHLSPIKGIRFYVGKIPQTHRKAQAKPPAETQAKPTLASASPEDLRQVQKETEKINDPELREMFQRLMLRSQKNKLVH